MSLRIGVLLSGAGSTLDNLARERDKGRLDAEFAVVVSSKPHARGLEVARSHGIPAHAVDRRSYPDERAFNDALHQVLDAHEPGLIVLAGFLSRFELRGYAGRVMNIHPALIPAFSGKGYYGDRVYRAVLESGVRLSGVTVHFCDEQYDTGPIILQRAVPVLDDDTLDTLRERVQACERELYPEAIRLFAQNRLQVDGRRVRVKS